MKTKEKQISLLERARQEELSEKLDHEILQEKMIKTYTDQQLIDELKRRGFKRIIISQI